MCASWCDYNIKHIEAPAPKELASVNESLLILKASLFHSASSMESGDKTSHMTGYIVRKEKGEKLLKKHDEFDVHEGESVMRNPPPSPTRGFDTVDIVQG